MEYELSKKILTTCGAPALMARWLLMYGRANASTKNVSASKRAASIKRSFRFLRDDCCSFTCFKNCTLLKYTFWYLRKLNRWIITGIASDNNAKRKAGYRKCISANVRIISLCH